MLNHWPILIALSLLAACGNEARRLTYQKGKSWSADNLTASVIPLVKQSGACEKKVFEAPDTTIPLFFNREGTTRQISQDLKSIIDGLFVRKPSVIKASYYNQETKIYHRKSGDVTFPVSDEEMKEARDLTVCPEVELYDKGSFESAGLASAYAIEKTHKKMNEVAPELKLAAIDLHVAPIFHHVEQLTNRTLGYKTNNAYYDPMNASITFLPTSGDVIKLWEIPMVGAHEYAHHVFQAIFPVKLRSEFMHHEGCFELKDKAAFGPETVTKTDGNGVTEVFAALNEGFADLIAHYSLSAEERSLKNIPCLQLTREVDSPYFSNQTRKSSRLIADKFFSVDKYQPVVVSCNENDFRAIHTMGSIFAYNTNLFFETIDLKNQNLKISALLGWVQDLKNNVDDLKSMNPEIMLKESLFLLAEEAMRVKGKAWDKTACDALNDLYPNLRDFKAICSGL